MQHGAQFVTVDENVEFSGPHIAQPELEGLQRERAADNAPAGTTA